jgi:hypothetical protein
MYNPIRRNRNIGTAKQGHGQNNVFYIPWPLVVSQCFYERLHNYRKEYREIHGRKFIFIIESTLRDFEHACSVDDVARMLYHIPPEDLNGLERVVFRQPKRKEFIFSPVWGRMIYLYEFENRDAPAIILEAACANGKQVWPKSLSVDSQKELERLRQDGHKFVTDRRNHIAPFDKVAVRNTQLYRTLLHEIGHYVHYLQNLQTLDHYFDHIATREKEIFAHAYAERQYTTLAVQSIVPFEQSSKTVEHNDDKK